MPFFSLCLIDLFVQNEVDLAMFTTLKDEDFISIGIRSFGARKIMLNAIEGKNLSPFINVNCQLMINFDFFN